MPGHFVDHGISRRDHAAGGDRGRFVVRGAGLSKIAPRKQGKKASRFWRCRGNVLHAQVSPVPGEHCVKQLRAIAEIGGFQARHSGREIEESTLRRTVQQPDRAD